MGSPKHTTDLDRDYTIPQDWERYTEAEHEMWRRLYPDFRNSAVDSARALPI